MNQQRSYQFLNPISLSVSIFVVYILGLSIFFPQFLYNVLFWVQQVFVLSISWFYVLVIFLLFCLCIYLVFSRYGKLRIGSLSQPKYNTFTWTAMLFSAGMGTGLIFSGVYEPVYHYVFPPVGQGLTEESLNLSYQLTFLHWGFSGWIIYTCMGLFFSHFCLYKKYPLRLSYMLTPIFKDKVHGPAGYLIDIIAVIAILFGVACSLGRGTMQMTSGLEHLFDLPISTQTNQIIIIAVITFCATLSVISGLNKGIRRLSEINIIICSLLLLLTLLIGPTVYVFNSFIEQSGAYIQNIVEQMTRIQSLGSVEWRSRWTIMYWAWWFAWSPFVGLFIAKISEGRTVRSFIIGAVLIPSLISFLWFSVFGGSALYYQMNQVIDLAPLLETEYSLLLFKFFEAFPFTKFFSILGLISVAVFFITSSDSASYIIHHIAASGNQKTSLRWKIYWAVLEGLLALVLLISGGIQSLELLVIITAFPFTVLLLLTGYGFLKEMRKLS